MHGLLASLDIPDLWQQNAARLLAEGSDVIVNAPTGAGKTRVFELAVESGWLRHGQAVFTVPTRALANDKWREWRARRWNVGIATGDHAENTSAPVLVATLETQRERLLSRESPALLAIDEYQMLADPKRGLNYELAIALPHLDTRLLLLSGSVRNPPDIAEWMRRLGRSVEVIRVSERPVPLDEIAVEQLPKPPGRVEGFWPRLAASARAAGLAPLLIFAPRRRDAERIARRIAEGLPVQKPLALPDAVQSALGKDLARLVARRVAWHHSGLPYATRAGIIEPLAKNAHLDVVVATTGLAAGINFSVRSVFVAETRYSDGPFQRELRADELLQMFGRAGRRGIDSRGTVIIAPKSPRLADSAPAHLRRSPEIDWPTLLRVMEESARAGGQPLDAAAEVCARLFSRQEIDLGFRVSGDPVSTGDEPDRFAPTREEFLDADDVWRPVSESRREDCPLTDARARYREGWRPALRVPAIIDPLLRGRLCKLSRPGGRWVYGKELDVAHPRSDGSLAPLPWVRRALRLESDESFPPHEFESSVLPLLAGAWQPGELDSLVVRERIAAVRVRFDFAQVPCVVGPPGRAVMNPPRRRARLVTATDYQLSASRTVHPRGGSPAHAWRKLGLVDATGVPTERGRVFSRFQAGEGLMIAAALEDARYPVEEIVAHLANLRGGYRFEPLADGLADRLAVAAHAAYGHLDYPGYLERGLNPGYGVGTHEAILRFARYGMNGITDDAPDLRRGDIERAMLEWQSLLRHIVHAPDARAPRWADLQAAARAALSEAPASGAVFENLLPAHLLQKPVVREAAEGFSF